MKIWLVSHSYLPAVGGIENYFRQIGTRFLRRGIAAGVICRRTDPALPPEEEIEGIRVIRHPDFTIPSAKIPVKPRYFTDRLARWLAMSEYLEGARVICRYPHYQAALSHLPVPPPSIYLPASVWPILSERMIPFGRVKEKLFARLWRKQMTFLEREALTRAGRVTVFSRNMRAQLAEVYGIDPAAVAVNPPGIDPERFRPGEPSPELLRGLSLPPDRPRILFLGRFSPEKNLSFLLRSLAPLLETNRASLILAGTGPLRSALGEEIERRGWEGRAAVIAPPEKIEETYSLGDIFVSPSRYESFGQTVLEAMASGLPVIALKNAPPRIRTAAAEIIEDGASGFIVPEEEAVFRKKAEQLLSSHPLRKKLGETGRRICRERYGWERHIETLLKDLYSIPNGEGGNA